jgi:hypothetical protein
MVMDSKVGVKRKVHDGPSEELEELHSLFLMYDDHIKGYWLQDSNILKFRVDKMLWAAHKNNETRRRAQTIRIEDDGTQASLVGEKQRISMKSYPGQKIHGFRLVYKSKFDDKAACCNVYIRTTLGGLECFRLANTLHNERKSGWSLPMAGYQMHSGWKGMFTTKMPVASSAEGVSSYFPSEGRLTQVFNEKAKFISWAALMAAGSIYGVVHLIAWNGPFKTETQRWMWRTSCFIIASPIVLLALLSLVFATVYWLSWLFDIKRRWIVRRLVLRPLSTVTNNTTQG